MKKTERVIDTGNKEVVAKGERGGERKEIGEGGEEGQTKNQIGRAHV